MPGNNNATRRKASAIARVLSHKAHTNAEKRRQLRLARAIELHGVNANHNAILAAENAIGRQQEANYASEKAAKRNNGSKKANNGSKKANNGSKKPANNGPTTWVTYQGKYQKMTVKRAKELGLK